MRKSLSRALLMAILVSGILVNAVHFGTVKASTNVTGIIGSDALWAMENSPYSLTGNMLVNNGVTLIIEAGVTVNLGNYYLLINGTVIARGTTVDKIQFIGGEIRFTPASTSWDEQTKSGSIIENAYISSTLKFDKASPKINNNLINGDLEVGLHGSYGAFFGRTTGTSPTISNNSISGTVYLWGGSPLIINNTIGSITNTNEEGNEGSPKILNNTIKKGIQVGAASPIISNNIINGTRGYAIDYKGHGGSPIISNNLITSAVNGTIGYFFGWIYAIVYEPGITLDGSKNYTAYIYNNSISDCSSGIKGSAGGSAVIENNLIFNTTIGIEIGINAVISRNSIFNNSEGINIGSYATIQNNTISDNEIGIRLKYSGSSTTLNNNNINGNRQNSIYSASSNNIDATYNWWGTTDTQAINQTIYDFKNDFYLGKVIFIPFLSEQNAEATPILEVFSWFFDAGTWDGINYKVNVVSNSTVSDFSFDPEGTQIQFNVIGESGTSGFCSVTIPKGLLNAKDKWIININGASVTPTVNEDSTNTHLYFTYDHSNKTIEIMGTTAIPEFPSWIILPLFLVGTLLGVFTRRRL